MAKIAELHNGTQIHFPDDMPDHEMDSAVQRHLGVVDPNILDTFTKVLGQHAKTLEAVKSGVAGAQTKEKTDAQMRDKEHKTHIIAQAAHVEATNNVATAMQKGMQDLLGPVSGLADAIEGNTPELIASVNKLSDTIVQVGKAIIDALHAPKEIYSGPDGKPKGTRTVVRRGA